MLSLRTLTKSSMNRPKKKGKKKERKKEKKEKRENVETRGFLGYNIHRV